MKLLGILLCACFAVILEAKRNRNTPRINPNDEKIVHQDFQCPQVNGLFPNPSECSSYFQCHHSIPQIMNCPATLHFNPKILVCDYPYDAGCTVGSNCPSMFQNLGGKCYYFAGRNSESWVDAWINCRQMHKNAVLASIETKEENDLILSYLRKRNLLQYNWWLSGVFGPKDMWFWFGTWTDEPMNFTNWCPGKPKSNYVVQLKSPTGCFNDIHISEKDPGKQSRALCEILY